MIYEYQYNVAAIIMTAILFAVYILRSKYMAKSNIIFLFLIICDFFAAVFDLISCFTISFPQDYPIEFNYFISSGYLLFYNTLTVLYFLYIDSKGKIQSLEMPAKIISIIIESFYIITICTSPWTHLIIYYDENLQYQHGPLFVLLFTLPFIMMAVELLVFAISKNKFNKYQLLMCVTLIIGMTISVFLQMIIEKLLIGQFFMSIILFLLYVTFENPAYYTYKDTQCLNRHAFIEILRKKLKSNKPFDLIIVNIADYAYISSNITPKQLEKLLKKLADKLFLTFKKDVFCYDNNKYVIFSKNEFNEKIIEKLNNVFNIPINVQEAEHKFTIQTYTIKEANLYEENEITLLVNNVTQSVDEKNANELIEVIKNKIDKKEKILNAIKKAIKNNGFDVFYQPIYNVKTQKFESAEALIRLFDDEIGFVNPEELIVIAEQNGYINKVGKIVFENVCNFISQNKIRELGIKYIEINLSPVQCTNKNLVNEFFAIMDKYNVYPEQINLEITETAELSNNEQILKNIHDFNDRGVKFSIDDYGTGFASANYLIKLPVSLVKIDKEILWSAMKDDKAMIILKNTIKMLKELDKKIVVEGVEDNQMSKFLKDESCDFNQGYFFSKPIKKEDFLEFLNKNN